MFMEKERYSKDDAVSLLQDMAVSLALRGETRYPRRGDFSDREVEAIKSHLGPWPRALEAAGLKPPRPFDRIERNREKRRAAKRRRREAQDGSGKE